MNHKIFSKKTASLIAAGILALFATASNANAVPLDGHLVFNFQDEGNRDNNFLVWLGNSLIPGGKQQFELQLDANTGTARVFGVLNGYVSEPGDRDRSAVLADDVSAAFDIQFSGLDFGIDPATGQEVVAIGREGATGSGSVLFESDFFLDGTIAIDIESMFLPAHPAHGLYHSYASFPFTLFYGIVPGSWDAAGVSPGDLYFASWLGTNGSVVVNDRLYHVTGDVHGTEVPEPTAGLLLLAGLFGAARKKRLH